MRPELTLLSKIGRKLLTDLLPAALASGLVGLVFSHLHSPTPPHPASIEMARIVHDADEIVLDYTRKEEDLRRQMAMTTVLVRPTTEPVRTDAAPTDRRTLRQREAKPAVALAMRSTPVKKTERQRGSAGASKLPIAPEPEIEKRQPGEPLALSSFTTVPPARAESENLLEGTWKGFYSVARKVPHWAGSAAEFVLDLPARAISSGSSSPEANFLKAVM